MDIGGTKNAKFGLQVDAHQGAYGGSPNVFTANVSGKVKVWPAKYPLNEDEDDSPVDWDLAAYEGFLDGVQSLQGVGSEANTVSFDAMTDADTRRQFKAHVREFVAHCREAGE